MATQAQVQHMVEINVTQNVNILMQHLINNPGEYSEEIMNVSSQPDYEGALADTDIVIERDEFGDFWILTINEVPDGPYDSKEEAQQAACENHNVEPYLNEAYEFYVVSDWMAHQLKQRGQMVEEIFDLTIWGRCATGQAVFLDGIMIEIYDENEVN